MDGNPQNLYADPEFQKLNPAVWQNASQPSGYEIPIVQSGNSDMTWVITSWIAANTDAAGLPGRPVRPLGHARQHRTTWA